MPANSANNKPPKKPNFGIYSVPAVSKIINSAANFLDQYVADFVCLAKRLIIELDGNQHNQSVDDVIRDKYLHDQGFKILRIWNNDLNQNLESILDKIYQVLNE